MSQFIKKEGIKNLQIPGEKLVTTHCCYCGMQCGMHVRVNEASGKVVGIEPRYDWPTTKGKLCPKGITAYQTIEHPDRLTVPLIRKDGQLVESTWEEAYDLIEKKYKEIQKKYGKDALSVFGGVSMTNEKCYAVAKYARVALGTRYIDYNGRFCMSSSAGGFLKTFGIDRGTTLPWPELEHTDCFFLAGTNTAECHPTMMQWLSKARDKGAKMIVVDPRETSTARLADIHLNIKPGTDAALALGMIHLLIQEDYVDHEYVEARCNHFEELKESVSSWTPEKTAEITGIEKEKIIKAAHIFGQSPRSAVMFARGADQHSKGVDTVTLYASMSLLRGMVGKFAAGVATLTGQANGQGGREHGFKSDLLPGYRKIVDPEAIQYISKLWGIDPSEMPKPGVSAYEMFDEVHNGNIRAMHVICSNPTMSAPNVNYVRKAFEKLDFVVVNDFLLSETAEQYADVVLPSTTWAEDEGTTTNLEGRVIRIRKVSEKIGQSKTDWEIVRDIAKRMGKGKYFPYENAYEIFEEFRLATKGGIADYYGITWERLDQEDGIFWPCPSEDHPGTPRVFDESFGTPNGKANLAVVEYRDPGEMPSAEYPHILTTGRVVGQYLSGNQTRRISFLAEHWTNPFVEIHPELANKYEIKDGDKVKLVTPRGQIIVAARVIATIRKDTLFVPFHWGKDLAVNLLTNPCLDPVSRMPELKVCAVRIEKQ